MKTVYVGLSGGVDSSVSAALLKQQGFNVVGVYMKNWTQDVAGVACPWKQDLADARAAAATLDIPFKVFDFQSEYRSQVVDAMVAEYRAGRTPNPDVMCNAHIKFDLFLRTALADGADFIATGHYARITNGALHIPRDRNKDQTYFLYRITPAALERTIFPLEGLTKPQVRELAAKFNLPTADKPDSQGICFIGEVGLREFLRQYIDAEPGPVLHHVTGAKLGEHQGAAFYTHGQRHGLGIGGGTPFYVTAKDVETNTVLVTDDPADLQLESTAFTLVNPHWVNEAPDPAHTYLIRTRHRAVLIPGTITVTGDHAHIELERSERAITPGQSAVVYEPATGRVLGGGIIA
jgi:tRNA-specific 2-thiouridylase